MTQRIKADAIDNGIASFFESFGTEEYQPLLMHASGALRFVVVGDSGVDNWHVIVTDGSLTVIRRTLRADVVVTMDRRSFHQVVTGRANATTALLRGAMAVRGDLRLLMLFQRLFPGPPRPRRSAPAAKKREAKGSLH